MKVVVQEVSQDESGPRPALGESSLNASSVDVLVEPALRIAGGESRGIALEDVEAVSGGWIPRINPWHEVPGIRPGHVDPTVDGRDVDVVAPEGNHARPVGFPVVVAGEVADPRLGPARAAIARLCDKRIHCPTRVPAVRRISGRAARGGTRVVSRIVV